MPKQKYLITKKKMLYQEKDPLYYNSPRLAKIIAKKFGRSTQFIETSFNQYFEALKFLGITEIMPYEHVKEIIKDFYFNFVSSMQKDVLGATEIFSNDIILRNSIKVGDLETSFHEFNHLISKSYKLRKLNDDTEIVVSLGYLIFITEKLYKNNEEYFDLFEKSRFINEGVTELLTYLVTSFINKKHAKINSGYNKVAKYAQAMYAVCGNKLFEGYFNGGSFSSIAKELDMDKNHLEILSESMNDLMIMISLIAEEDNRKKGKIFTKNQNGKERLTQEEQENYQSVADLDYHINCFIINMFQSKMKNEILQNINQYNYTYEIYSSLLNSFIDFGKRFYFGESNTSIFNINRNPVLIHLTNSFRGTVEDIKGSIKNKDVIKEMDVSKIKLIHSLKVPNDNELWEFYECADEFNKYNYGFIHYMDGEIHPTDYLSRKNIFSLTDLKRNSYIDKKNKFENVDSMFSEEAIENLKNEYSFIQ